MSLSCSYRSWKRVFVSTLFVYVRMIIFTVVDLGKVYKELYDLPIILLNLAAIFLYFNDTSPVIRGGMGVTSAWSPLGNFLEGQAHPNVFAFCIRRTRFFYFL